MSGDLSIPEALLLGLVEGITEYLPISSTGHLLFVNELIGLGSGGNEAAADTFAIVIQAGAILAVLLLLRRRVASMVNGVLGRDSVGRDLARNISLAFVPMAVLGLVAGEAIKDALFGPLPIVVAWALGGVVLLFWRPGVDGRVLEHMGARTALVIGVAQMLALWPGVSRSLVTLIAAVLAGMSLAAAIEFSFLLGCLTLLAATGLDLLRNGGDLVEAFGWVAPAVGLVAAFLAAAVSVRWLLGHLSPAVLRGFGVYRLAAAVAGLVAVSLGAV